MQKGTMTRLAGTALLAASAATAAQERTPQDLAAELRALKQELAEQRQLLQELRQELARTDAARTPPELARTDAARTPPEETNAPSSPRKRGPMVSEQAAAPPGTGAARATADAGMPTAPPSPAADLAAARATGRPPAGAPAGAAAPANPAAQPPAPAKPAASTAAAGGGNGGGKGGGKDGGVPEVAPLFEQPGVLTPRGKYVLEPALQFGYSSSNRVALVGYSIIPSLLIGLVDVREVKRNTTTFALTGRAGITNRLEIEARVPYVYRSDSTVSRELFTGTAVERVFDTSGKGIGDVELAARYQLNHGGADGAYYVAGLRFKTRTGRDPFEVMTDCVRRCVGENATGTGLPLELPTGSGFYALQPSLTVLLPSDPAVFFGSVSYLHNFKRQAVQRTVLGGEKEMLGEVDPGGVFGFNFGIGIALNDKATLSMGYDHNSIERMRQGGAPVPGAVRTQLGTLLVGYSYRKSPKRSINVAVGAGLTRDTPDVTLTVRVPTTF